MILAAVLIGRVGSDLNLMIQWAILILKERKLNYFLADRIFIPSDFSTSSNNAAFIASGNTFQRPNYLGITKTVLFFVCWL